MLVVDQPEVGLGARLLLPSGLHLVLHLDDVLPQDEADIEELLEDAGRDGHVVAVLARVPDEDGAVLAWLEDAVGLGGQVLRGTARSETFMV